jgi:CBS domain-containing protein
VVHVNAGARGRPATREGWVVSHAELTGHVDAQDADRDSNTTEVFVGHLREKLGPDRRPAGAGAPDVGAHARPPFRPSCSRAGRVDVRVMFLPRAGPVEDRIACALVSSHRGRAGIDKDQCQARPGTPRRRPVPRSGTVRRLSMNAAQVMSRQPVVAGPTMSARDVARLLVEHGISAVPVTDASGALLGIVSEGDLVRRGGVDYDERRSWWLQALAEGEDLAPEFLAYVRSGDRRVDDLMTREVVTVEETTTLPEIARRLQENRVKRVPVLREGKVVGIISRADLLRALVHEEAAVERPPRPATPFEMSRPRTPAAGA